jgi:hypothetical protein
MAARGLKVVRRHGGFQRRHVSIANRQFYRSIRRDDAIVWGGKIGYDDALA